MINALQNRLSGALAFFRLICVTGLLLEILNNKKIVTERNDGIRYRFLVQEGKHRQDELSNLRWIVLVKATMETGCCVDAPTELTFQKYLFTPILIKLSLLKK